MKGGDYVKNSIKVKNIIMITLLIIATAGITYAAFGDKGKVLGSKFSVGSADIKLYMVNTDGTSETNLVDEKPGPNFVNITPNWTDQYLVKIYNNGSSALKLFTTANYETINDPDDLRSIIFVEPIIWNDNNTNGELDDGETGNSLGKKSIVKWKTEGYDLSTVDTGETKSFILKFSTEAVSETKQGKSAIFDFMFDSESI